MVLDAREEKIAKTIKWPEEFKKKVDKEKVNMDVVKQWFAARWKKYLPDDDLSMEFAWETFSEDRMLDIKQLQIRVTGFIEKKAPEFAKDLWTLLLSAQDDPNGIPPEMLEAKKQEILEQKSKEKEQEEKARDRNMERNRRFQGAGGRDEGGGRGKSDNRRPEHGREDCDNDDRRNDRGPRGDRGGRGFRRQDEFDRSYHRRGGRDDHRDSRHSGRRSRSPARLDSYVPSHRRRDSPKRRSRSRSPRPSRRLRSPSPRRLRSPSPRRSRSRSPRRGGYSGRRRQSSTPSMEVDEGILAPLAPRDSVSRPISSNGVVSRPTSSNGEASRPTSSHDIRDMRRQSSSGVSTSSVISTKSTLGEKGRRKLAAWKAKKQTDGKKVTSEMETA